MRTSIPEQHPQQSGGIACGTAHLGELADKLKALADATRLHIIYLLMTHGEMCVCELMPALGLSQSIVSFHLKTLKYAGFISSRKEGKWMYYTLNHDEFQQFCDEFGAMFNLGLWPEKAEVTPRGDAACRHPECRE